jgi:predicted transcriptional regulator
MLTTRERLHELIDELPDAELNRAARLLDELRAGTDPALRAFLEAPYDDEPLTEEDRQAIEEGMIDVRAGRLVSDEEMGAEFGPE